MGSKSARAKVNFRLRAEKKKLKKKFNSFWHVDHSKNKDFFIWDRDRKLCIFSGAIFGCFGCLWEFLVVLGVKKSPFVCEPEKKKKSKSFK